MPHSNESSLAARSAGCSPSTRSPARGICGRAARIPTTASAPHPRTADARRRRYPRAAGQRGDGRRRGSARRYPTPAADSVTIDRTSRVILARADARLRRRARVPASEHRAENGCRRMDASGARSTTGAINRTAPSCPVTRRAGWIALQSARTTERSAHGAAGQHIRIVRRLLEHMRQHQCVEEPVA
jgi:hypothetical protein